jgi:histidyl-tRNA synthetase
VEAGQTHKNKVMIKNMQTGEQETVERNEIAPKIKKLF